MMSSSVRPSTLAVVWLGPGAAIVLIAVAGHVFGVLGAVLAAGCAAAALLFSAAEVFSPTTHRRSWAIAAMAVVLAIVALFASQGAVPWARYPSLATTDPADYRGQRITAQGIPTLRGALLAGADLAALDLRGKDLAGVSAPGSVLRDADLTGASLRGADLRGADLRGACFERVDLAGADISGAKVDEALIVIPPGTSVSGNPLPPGERAPSCRRE